MVERRDRREIDVAEPVAAAHHRRREDGAGAVSAAVDEQREAEIEVAIVFAEDDLVRRSRADREEGDARVGGNRAADIARGLQAGTAREPVADRQQRAEPPRRPIEDRQGDRADIAVMPGRQRRGIAIEQVRAVKLVRDTAPAGRSAASDAHRAP